jgi:hypothetical protein
VSTRALPENRFRPIWKEDFNWSEQLWRYFKVQRFGWLLENAILYFAAATQFADRFEGAAAVLPPDFQVDPRYVEREEMDEINFHFKRLYKINCWHRADYESDAMWHLYAEQRKGLAVCSTPERLRSAIQPFRLRPNCGTEDLWAGPVKYEDLLKVRVRSLKNERYFLKHRAFEWEREFRLLISLMEADEFTYGIVPERGIEVGVDLDALIERIMIGPELSIADTEIVVELTRKAGLGGRICKSSLLGEPRFY